MLHSVPSSKPSLLSESLLRQLNLYTLAVGAAGAAALTAQPAQAEIVFTPTHVRLASGQVPIDLNNDGTADFFLFNHSKDGSCCIYSRTLSVAGGYVGSSQNGVIGLALWANALKAGQAIGPRQLFEYAHFKMANAFNDSNSFFFVKGPFANTTNRYLGLLFRVNGETHYGWARFSVVKAGFNGSIPVVVATLTGYAYETVPNQAIIAGKTSGQSASLDFSDTPSHTGSLGLLAIGAPALEVWRKSEAEEGVPC
jgi:hypothetical protein